MNNVSRQVFTDGVRRIANGRAAMGVVGFRAGDFISREMKLKSPSVKQPRRVYPSGIAVPPHPSRQVAHLQSTLGDPKNYQ